MDPIQAIERAIALVMQAFTGQKRIGPVPVPAATHSLSVGLSLITYGYDLSVVIAGFCHDLIEDTTVTKEDMMMHGKFMPKGTAYQGHDYGSQYRSIILVENDEQQITSPKRSKDLAVLGRSLPKTRSP